MDKSLPIENLSDRDILELYDDVLYFISDSYPCLGSEKWICDCGNGIAGYCAKSNITNGTWYCEPGWKCGTGYVYGGYMGNNHRAECCNSYYVVKACWRD